MDEPSSIAPELTERALTWIWRMPTRLSDATPWEHGVVYRCPRFHDYSELNHIRVKGTPELDAGELSDLADDLLGAHGFRRISFERATAAEPLRQAFRDRGYIVLRMVWMHHDRERRHTIDEAVGEVEYDAVNRLRVAWDQEDFPGHDPIARLAQAKQVQQLLGVRVLAVQRDGAPVAFADIDLGDDEAELGALYVAAEHRGGGLGTKLTAATIALTDVSDLWICADDEDRPKHLYARMGFRPVTTTALFLRVS